MIIPPFRSGWQLSFDIGTCSVIQMQTTLEQLRNVALATTDRALRAREAAELIRAARDFHWVGLYDISDTEVAALAWSGPNTPAFPRFPITRGLNGAAVASRQNVIVQDVAADPRYLTTFGSTCAEAIFVVAHPQTGHIIGTIDVESDRCNAFTPDDERDFSVVVRRRLRHCGHNWNCTLKGSQTAPPNKALKLTANSRAKREETI